jgi:hypothetical protein
VPLVQVTDTLTEAPLAGENTLLTVNVASFRVFAIVQLPGLSSPAEQDPAGLPLAVYPDGIGLSVAVQFGVPVKAVTVHVFGDAVETLCVPPATVPLVQVTETLTEAALAGDHTLFTVKVAGGLL